MRNQVERLESADITDKVVASFDGAPGARTREVMQSLVGHLYAFAAGVGLTQEEWEAA